MRETFFENDREEDLLSWCKNLEALGDVVGFMAFSQNHDGDECFKRTGEYLGRIISDYATLIHETLGDIYWEIGKIFDDHDDSKIGKLEREVSRIKNRLDGKSLPYDVKEIVELFKEFEPILNKVIDLNNEFFRMKEEGIKQLNVLRRERALAGADTEAKAQSENG